MRKFSSYGPVNTRLHYYAPRGSLIETVLSNLAGEDPDSGGHYITVWGPRQTGKTWVMHQVLFRLREDSRFDVVKLNLDPLIQQHAPLNVMNVIGSDVLRALDKPLHALQSWREFEALFSRDVLEKPLILILDEFDALPQEVINPLVRILRGIYINRQGDPKSTAEKEYLLHGVALIGVRSVLGVENVSGSPFNVQRSVHIPNLTFEEAQGMFQWYEQESGQRIEADVIERLYAETNGQPGLTCWLGELLTETYNKHQSVITQRDFEIAYAAAIYALPNSNILNIISKARQEPYEELILNMFKTDEKIEFAYDDPHINFLYMNGIIEPDIENEIQYFAKFSCPLIQKRLFNYFARKLFHYMGKLHEPFEKLDQIVTPDDLHVKALLQRYEQYLQTNRDWLLKDAPRRADLRIYEAVYHFNLYMYVHDFLRHRQGQVFPEFPTGNGKIDLILLYSEKKYGLEVKSYTDDYGYQKALVQAARYGQQLQLMEITLAFFVEYIDEANRNIYEKPYHDQTTGVSVIPVFIATGR